MNNQLLKDLELASHVAVMVTVNLNDEIELQVTKQSIRRLIADAPTLKINYYFDGEALVIDKWGNK